MKSWTIEQEILLKLNYGSMATRKLALVLGRSYIATMAKAEKLGLMRSRWFTKEQEEQFILDYQLLLNRELSEKYGLSIGACAARHRKLRSKYGIPKKPKKTIIDRTLAFGPAPQKTAPANAIYAQYKRGALRRNLSFELSKEQLNYLVSQDCFYCKKEPSNLIKTKSKKHQAKYSGVDRINSSIGYTIDNCVPCCHTCNTMKMALSVDDFYDHIERIYNNRKKA